jgi:hypothetical protein
MSAEKRAPNDEPQAEAVTDRLEEKLVAFAEQLGTLVGTVQGRAEGWLDREALTKEIGRIQRSAADLLSQMKGPRGPSRKPSSRKAASSRPASNRSAAASTARPDRGPVDAPGKRHRKPAPQERVDKRMGEPSGKKLGQKTFKGGNRRGRG